MTAIEIKEKSFWGIWCRLTRKYLPESTCGLVWHMIFTILTFPLWVFPGIIINAIILWNNKYTIAPYYYYILLNFFIFILGTGLSENVYPTDNPFMFYLIGILIMIFVIIFLIFIFGIIIGMGAGIIYIINKIQSNYTKEKQSAISSMYYSLKEKHCSKINWR